MVLIVNFDPRIDLKIVPGDGLGAAYYKRAGMERLHCFVAFHADSPLVSSHLSPSQESKLLKGVSLAE